MPIDKRVLVVGETDDFANGLGSAEIQNSVTGSWSRTGSLHTGRYTHIAALLPNGTVLVAGGAGAHRVPLGSAEIYDPATGAWTVTGLLASARWLTAACLWPTVEHMGSLVALAADYREGHEWSGSIEDCYKRPRFTAKKFVFRGVYSDEPLWPTYFHFVNAGRRVCAIRWLVHRYRGESYDVVSG